GEALRPESPLAARRTAMFERIGTEFGERLRNLIGATPDPFVIQGLLVAHEGIIHAMLMQDPVDDAAMARAKAAMIRITSATISAQDAHLPPLPLRGDDPTAPTLASVSRQEEG